MKEWTHIRIRNTTKIQLNYLKSRWEKAHAAGQSSACDVSERHGISMDEVLCRLVEFYCGYLERRERSGRARSGAADSKVLDEDSSTGVGDVGSGANGPGGV